MSASKAATLPPDLIHEIVDNYLVPSYFTGTPLKELYLLNKHWFFALQSSRTANLFHHSIVNPIFDEEMPNNETLLRWIIRRLSKGNVNNLRLHLDFYLMEDYKEFINTNASIFASLKFAELCITYFKDENENEVDEDIFYDGLPVVPVPPKLNTKSLKFTGSTFTVRTRSLANLRNKLESLELTGVTVEHRRGLKFKALKTLVIDPQGYEEPADYGDTDIGMSSEGSIITNCLNQASYFDEYSLLLRDTPNLQVLRVGPNVPYDAILKLPKKLNKLRVLDINGLDLNPLKHNFPKLKTLICKGRNHGFYFSPKVKQTFENSSAVKSVEVMKLHGNLACNFIEELNSCRLNEALQSLIDLKVECEAQITLNEAAFKSLDEASLKIFKERHPKLTKIKISIKDTARGSDKSEAVQVYC